MGKQELERNMRCFKLTDQEIQGVINRLKVDVYYDMSPIVLMLDAMKIETSSDVFVEKRLRYKDYTVLSIRSDLEYNENQLFRDLTSVLQGYYLCYLLNGLN